MTEVKILKPSDGVKVRHPGSLVHLSESGEPVQMNSYWVRRLSGGDVVEVLAAPLEKSAGGKK